MSLQGFNLLKKQVKPATLWEKIYAWVLGTARIVIIIVEVLVVGAFAARIAVDTISSRLEKEIEKRNSTLAVFAESETRYRQIQSRVKEYQNIWESSSNYSPAMYEVENYLGANFTDLRIEINGNQLLIRAEGDVSKISQLEENIKTSSRFKNVETFDLTADTDGGSRRASFGIRAIIIDYNTRTLQNGN